MPREGSPYLVVAASNSPAAFRNRADYVCDGIADQEQINAALSNCNCAKLCPGTFYISGPITPSTGQAVIGSGPGTILMVPNGHNANLDVIQAISKDHLLIAELKIDGNQANQAAGAMNGISFSTVSHSKIAHCWVENVRGHGIYFSGANYNTITGNTCRGNVWHGIHLRSSSDHNAIIENTCNVNSWGGVSLSSSDHNTLTGNTCQGNSQYGIDLSSSDHNTATENTVQGNGWAGIDLDSSSHNTVVGNTVQGNDHHGIDVHGSSNYNNITGNTIQGNDWRGISLDSSSHNTVVGNAVTGNSQAADNTNDGIYANNNSDYNNIQGNTVRHAGGANQHRNGIRINSADCDGNLVINNDLYNAGRTADYSDAGTGTIYHNNRTTAGWVP